MKKKVANIALILIAFAIQNCIFPFIPFLALAPNLMIILVFTLGFMNGEKEGLLYGLICGVLFDLFYSTPFGYFILCFIWIGFMNGYLSRYFYEEYIWIPLLLCTVNELFYNLYIYIFRFFTRSKFDFLFYLKHMVLPEIIITLLFTLILYRVIMEYNKLILISDKGEKGAW